MDCVVRAGQSDQFEIQSSQIALQRSQNADVRAFAQRMIDDHTRASQVMMQSVQNAGITPPPPPPLPADMAARLDMLRNASAADFDTVYLREQVMAHEMALALHQGCSTAPDASVSGVSTQMVPIIQDHLTHVRTLSDTVTRRMGERG